jgi:pyrroloquinoline-quinone synthase
MALRDQLQAIVDQQHLLTHPFYIAWSNGQLTLAHLKSYAIQYFQNVLAFPTYVSAVHFNTPAIGTSIALRQELLENLIEEERGQQNHPALWQQFAHAVGATDAELTETTPLETTTHLISTFRRLCLTSPFYAGLAALYVYESQIPAIATTKIAGLRKFYGITNAQDYRFFSVHQSADEHHSATELELIERYADTPAKQAEVLEVANQAATALWQFLDGVYEAYCQDYLQVAD